MTDQELILAIRFCGNGSGGCARCPQKANCDDITMITAADHMERLLLEVEKLEELNNGHELFEDALQSAIDALIRENKWLNSKMTKWVGVDEYLPVLTEKEIDLIEKFGIEFAPEYIVLIKGADNPTVLRFDGIKWVDDNGTWYRVSHWMPLPEPPSTEGVE